MTRWSGFLLLTGKPSACGLFLEKSIMSCKKLPPINVPKDELKAIVARDKERFASSGNLTPLRAIRLKCLDCCGESALEVKLCTVSRCALYPYRMGKNPDNRGEEYVALSFHGEDIKRAVPLTAFQTIKEKCKDCSGPDFKASECSMDEFSWCPLLHYRKQREAKRRAMTPEQRAILSERLRRNLS